jgi:hypothetical protein
MAAGLALTIMRTENHDARSHFSRVHPRVYEVVAALAIWLILSAWVFFAGGGYTSLSLGVVTLFFLMAVGLPLIMSRVGHGLEDAEHDHRPAAPFQEWASGDIDVSGGRLLGYDAAVQVLLPIAAVSIGMTLIGLAFYFALPTVSS